MRWGRLSCFPSTQRRGYPGAGQRGEWMCVFNHVQHLPGAISSWLWLYRHKNSLIRRALTTVIPLFTSFSLLFIYFLIWYFRCLRRYWLTVWQMSDRCPSVLSFVSRLWHCTSHSLTLTTYPVSCQRSAWIYVRRRSTPRRTVSGTHPHRCRQRGEDKARRGGKVTPPSPAPRPPSPPLRLISGDGCCCHTEACWCLVAHGCLVLLRSWPSESVQRYDSPHHRRFLFLG